MTFTLKQAYLKKLSKVAKEMKNVSDCLSGQRKRTGMLLAIVTSAGETDLDEKHFSLTFSAAGRPRASFIYPLTLDCRCSEDMALLCQISFFRWGRCERVSRQSSPDGACAVLSLHYTFVDHGFFFP